jgi:hypothetical protein
VYLVTQSCIIWTASTDLFTKNQVEHTILKEFRRWHKSKKALHNNQHINLAFVFFIILHLNLKTEIEINKIGLDRTHKNIYYQRGRSTRNILV